MALALLSEPLWLWTLLLFPSNLSFTQQQKRPSSVLGGEGTSTSQGEKICLSLCTTARGPDLVLLQQCTLTASTGFALHCPEGKLRPEEPTCSATKLKPPLSGQSQHCGHSCSFHLPTCPSVQPQEGHTLLGLEAMPLGGGVLGPRGQ